MCVHVSCRDAWNSESLPERSKAPIPRTVIAQERSLQLDPEPVLPEHLEQPPHGELVVHAAQRTAAETHQPFGMLEDIRQLGIRLRGWPPLRARVRMHAGENATEV